MLAKAQERITTTHLFCTAFCQVCFVHGGKGLPSLAFGNEHGMQGSRESYIQGRQFIHLM